MELFGWQISRRIKDSSKKGQSIPALVPEKDDGAIISTAAGGHYGQYVDVSGGDIKNQNDLIRKYRWAASQPEIDMAINDIIDQAIASGDTSAPIALVMSDLDQPDRVKEEIIDQFNHVIKLLGFNHNATDIFRDWYVDGRLYYHLMIDPKNPKVGIKEVRKVDPTNIRKIKEITTKTDPKTMISTQEISAEYYVYGEIEDGGTTSSGVKVDVNSVVYCPSGLHDETGNNAVSYIHKSLKLINQLRMLEDALVIYRISRAPERRIFYIDVGNLPKGKAEQYVEGIMSKYRNKLVYDVETGDIRDDRKSMSMLEDFWLPRREGGRGTEITTLPGGENLGQIEDVLFFQKKLYRALNVPIGRLEQDNAFSMGRSTEINRDEVKFQKFIDKIRNKFSSLILDMLRVQLILKGVMTDEDWKVIREDISLDFVEDNYFAELKEMEILRERMEMLSQVDEYIGKYFSNEWVRRNILRLDDETIKTMQQQIDDETKAGEIDAEEEV
tara:strand:+ start:1596 stop:3092 length:1497 start_codon:yes stop_codon:yes gene_type:complete